MALIIAGTNSGCGKSTISIGLMAALVRSGRTVQPFKAGPDFIDPGIHALVTGRISRNLDLWMCGPDYVRASLARHSSDADASIIEGVMGFYDGAERSTAALAAATGAKGALVVDAYGMAESAAAIVRGFATGGGMIDAVIFNRVGSERHMQRLTESVHALKNDGLDIEVLGCLPRGAEFRMPERHLGLVTAEDSPIDSAGIDALARAISDNMDMKAVLKLAQNDKREHAGGKASITPLARIAVARDRAFSFYYQDNLDMLEASGAELVCFSPLKDESLPDGIGGIYIGGGYPELNAERLSANRAMALAIRDFAESGSPVYAECGGLMYLSRGIRDMEGRYHPMCGVFHFDCVMRNKRAGLGYREAILSADCVLGAKGDILRGHEFRYSEAVDAHDWPGTRYNVMGEAADGPVISASYKNTLASYTHIHFGSRPEAAGSLVRSCKG